MDHRRHIPSPLALLLCAAALAAPLGSPAAAGALGVTVGGDQSLLEVDLGDGQSGSGQDGTDTGGGQTPPQTQSPAAAPAPAEAPSTAPRKQTAPAATNRSPRSTGNGSSSPSSDAGDRQTTTSAANSDSGTSAARNSRERARATKSKAAPAGVDAQTTIVTSSTSVVPWWAMVLAAGSAIAALIALARWIRARRRRPGGPTILESVDPVTGLASADEFERRLDEEIVRARRFDQPLGLMLLDIDGFATMLKKLDANAVDASLCDVADTIRDVTRPTDFLAHLDGGLFAVICPHSGINALIDLRGNVERAFRDDPQSDWLIDVGLAEMEEMDVAPHEVITRARIALASRHEANHLAVVS